MSQLRPTLVSQSSDSFCPRNGTAYFMVYNAVRARDGLLHGKLEDHKGHYCAIGSYFEVNKGKGFPSEMVDEIAAVNDSMPSLTMRARKTRVLKWLRWKMNQFGIKP